MMEQTDGMTDILIKFNSSNQPWDRLLLQHFLDELSSKKLIGEISWVQKEYEKEPVDVNIVPVHPYEPVFKLIKKKRDASEYFLMGNKRGRWEMLWSTYPFNEKYGRIEGINTLFFQLSCNNNAVNNTAQQLLEIFKTTCNPQVVEYGTIHLYREWVMDESKPITIGPMFRSVYWANYLGADHLKEFDVARLKSLSAPDINWQGDEGLFFLLCKNILEVNDVDVVASQKALNTFFREALLPGSKWK